MVWGGATFDVIRRINSMRRQQGSKRVRVPRKKLAALEGREEVAEMRESFDCFFSCGNCGFLQWAEGAGDEAKRTIGAACPACGANAWVDLGHLDSANALRDAEAHDRMTPFPWMERRAKLLVTLGSLAGGALSVLAFAATVSDFNDVVPFSVFLGMATAGALRMGVYPAVKYRLFEMMDRRAGTHPARWRIPIPIVATNSPRSDEVQGEVRAEGPLLRTPVTDRECIAYEISILFDVQGDARGPRWVLEEEASTGFSIGGRSVDAGTATLEIPLEAVDLKPGEEHRKACARFLRERGLFFADGEFEFFESVVLSGHRYTLAYHRDPEGSGPVIRG